MAINVYKIYAQHGDPNVFGACFNLKETTSQLQKYSL